MAAGLLAGGDQRQAVAAGEAGQVAHVHRRADEQRVDAALGELGGQPLGALGAPAGGGGARHEPPRSSSSRSSFSASA